MIKKIIIVILISLSFYGCEYNKKISPSGRVIHIGVLAPQSGQNRWMGIQGLLGLEASREMKEYLKNGDAIIFEVVDTQSTIIGSKKAFTKLVDLNVSAVISFMGSTQTVAIKEDLTLAKIPIISTLATDNNITSADGYITQVCMDNKTQVIVASHYIRDERFMENIGIVYNAKSHYFSSLAHEFKEYFIQLGGNIAFFIDVSCVEGINKFNKVNGEKIDMLFNSTNSILAQRVFKVKEKQKFAFNVLGVNGFLSDAIDDNRDNLQIFEGTYLTEHYASDVSKSDDRKRLESLLAKDNLQESSYALLSYDGYKLLMYALENCSTNRECINTIVQNSDVIKGVSGNFSMIDAKSKREIYIDKIVKERLKKEVVIY